MSEIEALREEVKMLKDMLIAMAEVNGMKYVRGHYRMKKSPHVHLVDLDDDLGT